MQSRKVAETARHRLRLRHRLAHTVAQLSIRYAFLVALFSSSDFSLSSPFFLFFHVFLLFRVSLPLYFLRIRDDSFSFLLSCFFLLFFVFGMFVCFLFFIFPNFLRRRY